MIKEVESAITAAYTGIREIRHDETYSETRSTLAAGGGREETKGRPAGVIPEKNLRKNVETYDTRGGKKNIDLSANQLWLRSFDTVVKK